MKILFIGQKGIPCRSTNDKTGRERRVEALATRLAKKGHQVVVTCARPYTPKSLGKYNGVLLKHIPSFYPDVPGGWLYDLLSVLYLLKFKPAVVHMNGWRTAVLAPLAVVLRPEATYIWTIDSWPTKRLPLVKWLARRIDGLFDVITAPSRELQHRILHYLQVRAMYVPDGYETADWPALGLAKIGIRTKNYNFTTAASSAEIRTVARAYKNSGLRRKLVVSQELKGQNKRLKSQFSFLHFTGDLGERALEAVIKGADLIILDSGKTTLNTVLTAMDAGKGVVATTSAHYQEVLGVTALMVKAEDTEGLTGAIKQLSNNVFRGQLGKKAQKRARAHFTWERILPEYIELYHYPLLRAVNIDSARAKLVTKKA